MCLYFLGFKSETNDLAMNICFSSQNYDLKCKYLEEKFLERK